MYEQKEKKISVFKNDKATTENKQPQYRGTLKLDDKLWNVSLWVAESKSGMKYFNGSIEEPREKTDEPNDVPNTEDLPF